jgi:hypothetical protein
MKAVNRAVDLFQTLWGKYWAVKKEERRISATLIQKIWRGHYKFRTLNPIIKCRKKMGKRTYYMFCWFRWQSYNNLCRMIKESIKFYQDNWKAPCFYAWAKMVAQEKLRKDELRKKFVIKMKYQSVTTVMHSWRDWCRKNKLTLSLMKRSMQNPHFDQWVRYTDFSKYMKKMNKATTFLQKVYRGRLSRKKTHHLRWAFSSIGKWGKAVILAALKRKALAEREWHIFAPKQNATNEAKLNELESRRLSRLQTTLEENEKAARLLMRKHLRTKSGRAQIDMIISSNVDKTTAENILYDRCIEINMNMKMHDFDAEYPPFMRCPNPHCRSTFISYEQFSNHLQSSEIHKDDEHLKNNANLHLKLHHTKAIGLLKEYFTKISIEKIELKKYLDIINCIIDIQEWRTLYTTSDGYLLIGLKIYDTYIASSSSQSVTCLGIENDIKKLEILKKFYSNLDKSLYTPAELEKMKFLRRVSLPKSWWRTIRGKAAKQYDEWTDEYLLSPMIYRDIEYKLKMTLFEYLLDEYKNNSGFWIASEGLMLEKWFQRDERRKHKELYKNYKEQRIQDIKAWARIYKRKEDQIAKTALTAVDRCRRAICDDLVDRYCLKLLEDKVLSVSAKEQKIHEKSQVIAHDAIWWIEEDLCEELYTIYMTTFLKNSLAGNRKDRKPLLVYGGFEADSIENVKDPEVYKKRRNASADLFKTMF